MADETTTSTPHASYLLQLVIYWAVVGIPLAWGVYKTFLKLPALFHQ